MSIKNLPCAEPIVGFSRCQKQQCLHYSIQEYKPLEAWRFCLAH
ncbi:hypothetical protein [Allocoleopsis franciscana]|nr:hypothetical protein [Allocoleopsis franciscana]